MKILSFCYHRRVKAENVLQHASKQDGSFLIRKSRSDYFCHVLSLYNGNEVNHYIIEQDTNEQPPTFKLKSDPTKGFSSLLGLIEHYKLSKVKHCNEYFRSMCIFSSLFSYHFLWFKWVNLFIIIWDAFYLNNNFLYCHHCLFDLIVVM